MELSKIELITNEIQQERNLLESVLDTVKNFLTNFEDTKNVLQIVYYNTDKMDEYHVVFFKAGFNAIVKKWINGGCKESPLEIENVIKKDENEDELPKKKGNKSNVRVYSYKYDELYIWGEFKRNYGVNLSVDKIHWWEFKAMWMALPSECEFNKIKGYRSYKGNDKDILELKEYYKLPLTQMEIEDKLRRDKLYEMLK